jgi:hypothetical protein
VQVFTRRNFLKTATAAVAATRLPGGRVVPALAAGAALTATQRNTFRSVVEAVAELPGSAVKAERADEALAHFEEWYASAPEPARDRAACFLDLIDGAAPNGFASRPPRERLALLRELGRLRAGEPDPSRERTTEITAVSVIVSSSAELFYPPAPPGFSVVAV